MSNFPYAYFKVERAKEHIAELQSVSNPLHHRLYRLRWINGFMLPAGFAVVRDDKNLRVGDPDSNFREFIYEPAAAIPQYFSIIIGDCIHNLRSALDYAATAVVRDARKDTSFVTFPFHEKRDSLVPAQSTGLNAIKAALPNGEVESFFKDVIKSYRDGNFPLWALTKLDKIDKHNALIPNVTISEIKIGSLPDPRIRDCLIKQDASKVIGIFATDFPINENEYNLELSAAISFAEGGLFGNEPVIPTLLNLAEVTLETLKAFDRFVGESKV